MAAPWPRISVVTPSFNQARFLEATLRSILLQGYPNLEYFVMDGGSTDGSVDIIKKYAPWLTQWVSERDGGQSAAINRGLQLSSGLFSTWINSDDMLYRDALVSHASRVGFRPGVVYVGDCLYIDEHGQAAQPASRPRARLRGSGAHPHGLARPRQRGHIVQPEVLFPRQLALDVGGLDVAQSPHDGLRAVGQVPAWRARRFSTRRSPSACSGFTAHRRPDRAGRTTQSLIDTAVKLVAQAHRSSRTGPREHRCRPARLRARVLAGDRPAGASRAAGECGPAAARHAGRIAAAGGGFRAPRLGGALVTVVRR